MSDILPIEVRRMEENEQLKQVLELRVAGMTLHKACATVGVPVAKMRKALDEWFAKNPALSAQAFREQELETLERVQAVLLEQMDKRYVMVNAGKVVYEPVLDADGRQVQHPEHGFPILGAPMEDPEPRRNAALAVLKVLERKAKMMGADLPSPKDAAPPGAGTDAPLTPEQEKAAMDHFLRRIAQRNAAGTAVDVTSKPVTPEKDDK